MKFVVLLSLALIACASAQDMAERCSNGDLSEGYYPHSTNCDMFYTCSLGYLIEHTCYNGVWNTEVESCDYLENTNCGNLVSFTL